MRCRTVKRDSMLWSVSVRCTTRGSPRCSWVRRTEYWVRQDECASLMDMAVLRSGPFTRLWAASGGAFVAAALYWCGSKDCLSRDEIAGVVSGARLPGIEAAFDDILVTISGVKKTAFEQPVC